MTKHIDVATLRDWLDEGRPVTVVDIRSADARAEWAIPGSIHVDAFAELRHGRPGPLATERLPDDRPIVAVCNAGKISEIAADSFPIPAPDGGKRREMTLSTVHRERVGATSWRPL